MSRHDDSVPLHHMLDHAREAVEMMRGRERRDLDTNRMLNLAVVRLLEIIGEAANRISEAGRSGIPDLPWPQIVGLRNRVIHGYDVINLDIVWKIVHEDLPPLIKELEKHVKE
jgi:uncharacterized protein with HEPN domain